jgi:DNA-binding transcriptional LysR family regulator
MRFAHVGEADLNLLKPLYALLEERQITRAAVRCGMSQPAMSRALERLRATFDDELLSREGGKFERTPRGDRLLAELQDVLPRLETALRGDRFEPKKSRHTVRLAVTEYSATVLVPNLMTQLSQAAPLMQVDLVSWNSAGVEGVEAGLVDLALVGIHDSLSLEREELFTDGFVCLVSKSHPLRSKRLTLKAFISYPHVEVAVTSGRTPYIDNALAALGLRRRVTLRTTYQLPALFATADSDMIFTTPRRPAKLLAAIAGLRIIEAPKELTDFTYGMAWHRRQNNDVVHQWVRAQLRTAAQTL